MKNTRCKPFVHGRTTSERGSILVPTVIMLFFVGGLSAALFATVFSESKIAKVNRDKSAATHLAEGAGNMLKRDILDAVANNYTVPTSGTYQVGGHDVNFLVTIPINPANGQPYLPQRIQTDTYGVQTLIQPLLVRTICILEGAKETLNQIIEIAVTPIFQYAIFYNSDLELLPGPNMTLSGRVHANGHIYVGCGNTLTVNSEYFRCTGNMYRKRKDDGVLTPGNVNIKVTGQSSNYNMWSQALFQSNFNITSPSGFDSAFNGHDMNQDGDFQDSGEWEPFANEAIKKWKGTVQTGEHGVTKVTPPSVGSIKEYEPMPNLSGGDYRYNPLTRKYYSVSPGTGTHRQGYFRRNADVVIIDDKAYDRAGTLLNIPNLITVTTMYDGRENKNVTVSEVDMSVLNSSGYFPPNGLLYAIRNDSTAGQPDGIRLKNGSTLAGRLTVVSETPIYVLGDYNSVNKKSAAIITDSINLLSNAWNNSKTAGTLPNASATTYNAAFITGAYNTTTGVYNGGFENLPRFHENWNSVTCTIRGSFINIYDSLIGRGLWEYGGDNYTAPNRNWDYDTAFNNISNMPPFTPNVARVKRSMWIQL